MTKSMTGLLTDILVAEGKLDDNALVTSIVPSFADKCIWISNCPTGDVYTRR